MLCVLPLSFELSAGSRSRLVSRLVSFRLPNLQELIAVEYTLIRHALPMQLPLSPIMVLCAPSQSLVCRVLDFLAGTYGVSP
jgi:hypothetical protein